MPIEEEEGLCWGRRNEHNEFVWRSTNGRFRIMWAGRSPKPSASVELYDAVAHKRYRGFINNGNAEDMAERIYLDNLYKIGLVACCGEKLKQAAPAHQLYQSALFKKSSTYAAKHYHEWFILSAKYGLVHPEQVIEPYDLTLKKMDTDKTRSWGYLVQRQLLERAKRGEERKNTGANYLAVVGMFYMHAGADYCDPLEDHIPMEFPMKGMGIGKQLAFYTEELAKVA